MKIRVAYKDMDERLWEEAREVLSGHLSEEGLEKALSQFGGFLDAGYITLEFDLEEGSVRVVPVGEPAGEDVLLQKVPDLLRPKINLYEVGFGEYTIWISAFSHEEAMEVFHAEMDEPSNEEPTVTERQFDEFRKVTVRDINGVDVDLTAVAAAYSGILAFCPRVVDVRDKTNTFADQVEDALANPTEPEGTLPLQPNPSYLFKIHEPEQEPAWILAASSEAAIAVLEEFNEESLRPDTEVTQIYNYNFSVQDALGTCHNIEERIHEADGSLLAFGSAIR